MKLIVVMRLAALREEGGEAAARVLPDLAMDVLRVLASSNLGFMDLGSTHSSLVSSNNVKLKVVGRLVV